MIIINFKKEAKGCIKFDAINDSLNKLPKCEYFINCIGVINKLINENNIASIIINGIPYKLANLQKEKLN